MRHFCSLFIITVLLFVSLAGCSTQRRCEKRLAFVENHCPDMFEKFEIVDTIIKDGWKVDTAFVISKDTVVDSFLFEKENIVVKLVKVHDTLKMSVESKPDTIVKTQYINVPQKPSSNKDLHVFLLLGALGALVFLLLGYRLSKIR